jgi:hypothetical protein
MSQATNRVNANSVRFSRPERAHTDLTRALSALSPHRVVGNADAADIAARADLMREVFVAAVRYEEAIVADTIDHLPPMTARDREEIVKYLWDSINEDSDYDIIADLNRAGVCLDVRAAA